MFQGSEKSSLIHPTLHPFGVTTTHLEEMVDWYAKVLGMTTNFQYQDPDGNSVELFVDTFGDWDKSTEYVRTSPEFHQNSMGTSIDSEQLMAARKAGATLAELHRRAYAGEFPPSHPIDLRLLM